MGNGERGRDGVEEEDSTVKLEVEEVIIGLLEVARIGNGEEGLERLGGGGGGEAYCSKV